jgi:hypothetical protein
MAFDLKIVNTFYEVASEETPELFQGRLPRPCTDPTSLRSSAGAQSLCYFQAKSESTSLESMQDVSSPVSSEEEPMEEPQPLQEIPTYDPYDGPRPSIDCPAMRGSGTAAPSLHMPFWNHANMAPIPLMNLQGLNRFLTAQSEHPRVPDDENSMARKEEELQSQPHQEELVSKLDSYIKAVDVLSCQCQWRVAAAMPSNSSADIFESMKNIVPTGCDQINLRGDFHALEGAKLAEKLGRKNRSKTCLSFLCFEKGVRILQEWEPCFTMKCRGPLREEICKRFVAANVYCTHELVILIEQGPEEVNWNSHFGRDSPLYTVFGEDHATLANHQSCVDLLQLHCQKILDVEPSNGKARLRWSWASLKKEVAREKCNKDVIRQVEKYLEGLPESVKKDRQIEECYTEISYGKDYGLRIQKALRRDVKPTDSVKSAQHSMLTIEDLSKLKGNALRRMFPIHVKTPLLNVVDHATTCKMLEVAKSSLAKSEGSTGGKTLLSLASKLEAPHRG